MQAIQTDRDPPPERTKGQQTYRAIVRTGVRTAYQIGIGGLTIGALARTSGLSKSGLYAHFGAKEALQLAVLDQAAEDFTAMVVRPALAAPRGEERLRELVERWTAVALASAAGPCLFVKAATELDEQEGPVRDRVATAHRQLHEVIARVAGSGVADGDFRADLDIEQFAFQVYGVMLSFYLSWRLLADREAVDRRRRAIDALVEEAHA